MHLERLLRDAEIGKSGLLKKIAQVIGVAEGHRPRRVRRLRRRLADPRDSDVERDFPVHIVGDRRPHRHRQPPAGPQRAAEIGKGGDRVGEEHDAEPRRDKIETAGREGMHLGVRQERRQIGNAALDDAPAEQAEHRVGNVNTGHMPACPNRFRQGQRRRAGAAADIEHPLAGACGGGLQHEAGDFDVARLLEFGAADPARSRDLVPVAPHLGIRRRIRHYRLPVICPTRVSHSRRKPGPMPCNRLIAPNMGPGFRRDERSFLNI